MKIKNIKKTANVCFIIHLRYTVIVPVCSILIFFLLNSCSGKKKKPVVNKIEVNSETISCFEKFEVDVKCDANYTNPYDYDQVAVTAVFYSPSGKKDTVDGFYLENFKYTSRDNWPVSQNSKNWKIRFTPNEIGKWKYKVFVKDSIGEFITLKLKFTCIKSNKPGFVRKGTGNYLHFDNNTTFFPIGLNVAWWIDHPIDDYRRWIDSCSKNGINLIRVWVTSWGFAFEWNDTHLKNYELRQDRAYFLEWLLDYAESKNVYIQLCLNYHGQFSTIHDAEWANNPYNTTNGGMCKKPIDFFTKSESKKIFENRLRYTIARYGYSTHLFSWEIFNEINNVDDYSSNVSSINSWVKETAHYIKQKDINNHLVTNSYNSEIFEPEVWKLAEIDYTQLHYYIDFDELENIINTSVGDYLEKYQKPVLNGEFGICSRKIDLMSIDSSGYYIHNVIWGTSFSGAIGSGISYWWYNYIETARLFHVYKPLSEFFKNVDFIKNNYKPYTPKCSTKVITDLLIGPAYSTFGKSPISSFVINHDGSLTPPASNMGRFVFGNIKNSEYKNPLIFEVDTDKKTRFSIVTSFFISFNPKLEVYLNGRNVISQPCKINQTYSFDVPAGKNKIKIDNSGEDWIEIKQFALEDFTNCMKSYALKSDSSIIGWVQNKKYNYGAVYKYEKPEIIKDGKIIFENVINGSYKVEWFNCSTGKFFDSEKLLSNGNSLVVNCPELQWDYAYKITYLGK